jgi:hypothetical protein
MGWLDLVRLARSTGVLSKNLSGEPFVNLRRAIEHFVEHVPHDWPASGIHGFDLERVAILRLQAAELGLIEPTGVKADPGGAVDPYSGIVPYWPLTLDAGAE